jgi:protein tyrosine phosphatase
VISKENNLASVKIQSIQSTQYWPATSGESMTFNNFLVKTIKVETSVDYVLSTLELTNLKVFYFVRLIQVIQWLMNFCFKRNETRRVTHCRLGTWPDFGLPLSPATVLSYVKVLKKTQAEMLKELGDSWTGNSWGPPIVAHCCAGLGRTGL